MANRLAQETSPYLLQHKDNPVDWHPWGDDALTRAREEDKPILLSIGYSACHWCHVMERESFEDDETAALMNRLFVPIKLDREERPGRQCQPAVPSPPTRIPPRPRSRGRPARRSVARRGPRDCSRAARPRRG